MQITSRIDAQWVLECAPESWRESVKFKVLEDGTLQTLIEEKEIGGIGDDSSATAVGWAGPTSVAGNALTTMQSPAGASDPPEGNTTYLLSKSSLAIITHYSESVF